jgi:hypothetical protein
LKIIQKIKYKNIKIVQKIKVFIFLIKMKTKYYKKNQKNHRFSEEKREAGKNLHVQPV